jgi:hypothetical protein
MAGSCASCGRCRAPRRRGLDASSPARRRRKRVATFPRQRPRRRDRLPVCPTDVPSRAHQMVPLPPHPSQRRCAASPGSGRRRTHGPDPRRARSLPAGRARRPGAEPASPLPRQFGPRCRLSPAAQPIAGGLQRSLHDGAQFRREPAANRHHAVVVRPGVQMPMQMPRLGFRIGGRVVDSPPGPDQALHVRGRAGLSERQQIGLRCLPSPRG